MSEYIKKEDVIKEFEAMLADGKGLMQVIEAVHNLPTTEIKQDRVEIIKEYCPAIKHNMESCPKSCLVYDYNCCFHLVESEQLDEAIAKIKEQEK